MTTITSSHVERPSRTRSVPWSMPSATPAEGTDDSNGEVGDWQAPPTWEPGTALAAAHPLPGIDPDWLALVEAAQERWLRENPF